MITTKRMVWADIGRILAIFCVVVVHTLTELPLIWTRIGVPIFIMLSGAFLLNKSENYKEFCSKRLLRLLRPWIFWTLVVGIFEILVNKSQVDLFLINVKNIFVTNYFMTTIFGLYLLTPILRILIKSAKLIDLWILTALWYLSISILPYFRNTLAFPISTGSIVSQIVQFSGYYLLGVTITKQHLSNRNILLGLVILGTLITQVFVIKSGQAFLSYVAPGIVLMAFGLFGLLFTFRNYFQKLIKGKTSIFIANISKTSLGVLFIQPLILYFFPTNMFIWIRVLLIFFLSVIIILALQKIPRLKMWVA